MASCLDLGETAHAVRRAVGDLQIAVEVLGDGKRKSLGTIVGRDGWILTKASELYGNLSCRLADGRVVPATVTAVSREHDLALLNASAHDLPEACWSDQKRIAVGTLVAAMLLEGHPTPNLNAFVELTEKRGLGVGCVFAGDPIRVGVRRNNHVFEFRFPLPNEGTTDPGESQRRSGFPSVLDSDIALTPDLCGGPVVDRLGNVVGVAIACRTPNGRRVYIIPAVLARKIAGELKEGARRK
jgi:S1-C subfamily serine protease